MLNIPKPGTSDSCMVIMNNSKAPDIQGYRKRWTGFETAITEKVLDGFTRLAY